MSPTMSIMALLSDGAHWLIAAGLLFSCLTDLRYRIVCNEISLALFVASSIIALAAGVPDAIGWIAYAVVITVVIAMTLGGAMGGGDAKLILALLPSLSAWGCLQFAVVMCLMGGVIGLAVVALSRIIRRQGAAGSASSSRYAVARRGPIERWLRHERARLRRGRSIPYVPAIAIGWLAAING